MTFTRCKLLFHQLPFIAALKHLVFEVCRKLLNSNALVTYSQTGEDRIITALLGQSLLTQGYYVEVGSNHPEKYSNTFTFYEHGWRGITIDANSSLVALHRKTRKLDWAVNALISNTKEELLFTEFEDSLVSSANAEHVEEWKQLRKIKQQRHLPSVSLTKILIDKDAPKKFELLAIDVEGHDFEVLASLDLTQYRPKLIVIEMHGFDLLNPESSKVYRHLVQHHYKLLAYAVSNGYFYDTSHQ